MKTAALASLVLAAAQVPLPPLKPTAPPAAAVPASDLPPYETKLERLSELLGTLSFLRDLCGSGDGERWRGKMAELMAAEGASGLQRDRLAGAFNMGLHDYQVTYRQCTPAASVVIERAMMEGAVLTRELSTRFGS